MEHVARSTFRKQPPTTTAEPRLGMSAAYICRIGVGLVGSHAAAVCAAIWVGHALSLFKAAEAEDLVRGSEYCKASSVDG